VAAAEGAADGIKMKLRFTVFTLLTACLMTSQAVPAQKPRFKAVAFDYFVIFDPSSITPAVERELPGRGEEFVKAWQRKQFDYAFLRSITRDHKDFFEVTGDALDFTARSLGVELSPGQRERLLNAYLTLSPWPDTVGALRKLRASGVRVITIANFSPRMLRSNADNAGITSLFDDLLSTQRNRSFKPQPEAYQLGPDTLHLQRGEIVFAAFGGWDAYGAKRFGYPTFWVNRFGLPMERLDVVPDGTSRGMNGLLEFVLGKEK
jgi:2-haloacid dehalogenase